MKFKNDDNYNIQITLTDGNTYRIYANFLHNETLDRWQGWHCQAGANRIYIDKNLDVWSGQCKNDYQGNMTTEWSLYQNHTVCKQDRCTGCTDDLAVTKWQP